MLAQVKCSAFVELTDCTFSQLSRMEWREGKVAGKSWEVEDEG